MSFYRMILKSLSNGRCQLNSRMFAFLFVGIEEIPVLKIFCWVLFLLTLIEHFLHKLIVFPVVVTAQLRLVLLVLFLSHLLQLLEKRSLFGLFALIKLDEKKFEDDPMPSLILLPVYVPVESNLTVHCEALANLQFYLNVKVFLPTSKGMWRHHWRYCLMEERFGSGL
jgi:hypothetical protein